MYWRSIMPLVGEMTEVTFFCLQRSVFFAVLVDFSCHQSTFMAIKIIMQELRDIAFKFSSAMTGVTEKAARLKSWQQTEPHRNGVILVFTAFWATSPPHPQIYKHHHQPPPPRRVHCHFSLRQMDDLHCKGCQCIWLCCCA